MNHPDLQDAESSTAWIDGRPFARHVRHVAHESRVPWRVIALLAGVSSRTVRRLVGHGHRPIARIRFVDAVRLIAITPDHIEATRHRIVPAGSTRSRLVALRRAGHDEVELSEMLAIPVDRVLAIIDGTAVTCTEMTRLRGTAACEANGVYFAADMGLAEAA